MQVFGYCRVSGKSQIEGDGFPRQEETIRAYAEKAGYEVVQFFREEGVSGTKGELDRPAFQEMMEEILRNGVRTIIVERLDRLAREYRIQESLLIYLASKNVTLINASTEENVTQAICDDPMKKALIQIQGIFAELEKNLLVKKLRKARDRKRQEGKCEGRKSYSEAKPEILEEIRRLHRKPKKGRRLSYQEIADQLNEKGLTTMEKLPFTASNVGKIIFGMK
jgi:DNA invertase Pin-like site-specific DNA recombinase